MSNDLLNLLPTWSWLLLVAWACFYLFCRPLIRHAQRMRLHQRQLNARSHWMSDESRYRLHRELMQQVRDGKR